MLNKVLLFVAGAAIGSVATWIFVKTKYEQIAEEEIESIREYYNGKLQNLAEEASKEREKEFEEEKETQAAVMTREAYEQYANAYKSEEENENEEEENDMENKPYVISPEEFGEEGYDQVSLTYYADGVLTDEAGDPIEDEDIERIIGKESLEHFGEYEDDSVFVRNDQLGVDYEILKDLDNYYND